MTEPDVPLAEGLPLVSPDAIEEQLGDELDNVIPTHGYQLTPMVALGGSAGGIAALQAFFRAMPADAGFVFVVILHLSPEHESLLPELLANVTSMHVQAAVDGIKVERNCVYVIPPGKHLTTVDGHLRLDKLEPEHGKRFTVDLFFRSLADTHGPHAAAIVISGADGDGAIGIKRIKERGGLTIAQDPEQAEHSGMPRSAIGTGMVDWVLGVSEMPSRLLNYFEHERRLRLPAEDGPEPATAPAGDDEAALRDILSFLRARTGRDFSYYKRATVVRRISRRLQINGLDDLPAYLAFLRAHQGEAGALLQDLLISVTNFFRDRDAFAALEQHIPELFANKTAEHTVRVWTPACATGEETYSMAMLLLEHAGTLDSPPTVQVFGCDLDEDAIRVARTGTYPGTISADVSEERLRRFFTKEHRGYRVRREVREIVLFAQHDLLKDAPFSRLDLISCRNLLIYLNRDAQHRVMDIFHFALQPQALMFLGSSESVEEGSQLFDVLDKRHRIYRHRPAHRGQVPGRGGSSTLVRALEAQERAKAVPVIPARGSNTAGAPPFEFPRGRSGDMLAASELHYRLIEQLTPPSVVVNEAHEIVHISEHAGQFLQLAGGEPSRSLLRSVHPLLRTALHAALLGAEERGQLVETTPVPFERAGQPCSVTLRVSPAADIASGHLLVVFVVADASLDADAAQQAVVRAEPQPVVRQLEREVESLRARAREASEQYETGTEELKASNEELQAMNEELRSASEELETSREELQSINEELSTVNHELKSKVDEVAHANSDLHNLMNATSIATIFLDRSLRVTRYTPSAVELFHFISTDIGRPVADLKRSLDYPQLEADAQQVIEQLTPLEREVGDDRRWFMVRALPYRTVDDRIAGAVLTFVDVTERKRAEQAKAADLADTTLLSDLSARLIIEDNPKKIFEEILSAAIMITAADAGTVQVYEPDTQELVLLVARGFDCAMTDDFQRINADSGTACAQALKDGARAFKDFDATATDDASRRHVEAGYLSAQATPLVSRRGTPIGMLNTHWRASQHRPVERQVRFLDLLARQAADLIEQRQVYEALAASQTFLEERVRERTNEVQRLFQRLITAQEEERQRIARNIHDQLGQQMTALRMNLEAWQRGAVADPACIDEAAKIQLLADELDQSIDFLTWELRPAALDHFGLAVALRHLVQNWSERFQVAAEFDISGHDRRFTAPVETNVYRLVQEALHNVLKHAEATHVTVFMTIRSQELAVVIEDNGKGFDVAATEAIPHAGLGLVSMRERAALVDGRLDVESTTGAGTAVFVRVPVAPEAPDAD